MQFSEAGGRTVASDITSMFASVDQAVHDTARLTTSFMETVASSDTPPVRTQKVLEDLSAGFSKVVEGRKAMVSAQKSLILMKQQSNLDVYDFGCYSVKFKLFGAKTDEIAA